MEELEDDPSSEMLAIALHRPAVYAAGLTSTLSFHNHPPTMANPGTAVPTVPTVPFRMGAQGGKQCRQPSYVLVNWYSPGLDA